MKVFASTWYHGFSSLKALKVQCPRCGDKAVFSGYGADDMKSWEEYRCLRCGHVFRIVYSSKYTYGDP